MTEESDQDNWIQSTCDGSSRDNRHPQNRTCKWTILDLRTVGLFYYNETSPVLNLLDLITSQTNMFKELSFEQNQVVQSLQSNITFNYSMDDITFGDDCLSETQENLNMIKQEDAVLAEDFLRNTVLMVHSAMRRSQPDKVSKGVLMDLFKSFVKMCGLIPMSGSEWSSKQDILQCEVSSEPDIILTSADSLESFTSPLNPVSVVSIVHILEDENMSSQSNGNDVKLKYPERSRPKRSISSCSLSSDESEEEPVIYGRIREKVLCQHAGDLVIHTLEHNKWRNKFDCKTKKSKYRPGIIVVGTQVTFTVLEYSFDHHKQLNSGNVEGEKSCIYYSEPMDILKKEDRDLLIEALVRMTNTVG
ncbi:uncharacterized protein LOC134690631 [Mytilus trossulus]|uniref:uncharacterized protein LOC134690631 n=1 Tax=Mytilus trossulus TaxID=6551 RepID=UPI003007CF07